MLRDVLLLASGGTLALLALWSWLLWRDNRSSLAAKTAIAMNLGIASYVYQTTGWIEQNNLQGLVLGLLARGTPALFWLFARVWFNDLTRLTRFDLTVVALYIANSMVLHFTFQTMDGVFLISGVLFRIGMIAFAGAGLWEAWRGREGDLIEPRRRLRLALICVVGLYVLAIAAAEIAVFNADAPYLIISLIGSSTVLATLAFCIAMFAVRRPDLFGQDPIRGDSAPPALQVDDPLAAKLLALMQADKPHRDERLTIAMLASRMGEQEYRLRRLINRQLGHRNFAQFLNSYRLDEVRQALADPAQRDVPILIMAIDAGFGSLGPFNRAFKDCEGITPSEYRAKSLTDSEIG
ncbi:MAG: helix-turn-helix domain-containing protein [Novosphingobium sp.]|uniref:helix-turn-helix transcriptional regulator n=1 Tax=Novosphingobium sp. TaxID=1874826 RepID=UPI0032B9077F